MGEVGRVAMIDQCGDMPYLSDVGACEQAHRMHDPRLVCLVHLSGVHAPHTFDSLVVDAVMARMGTAALPATTCGNIRNAGFR